MEQGFTRIEVTQPADGVPLPIVTFNRWILVAGIVIGVATQQPLATTILLLLLLPSVVLGQRWSPIAALGRRLFAHRIAGAEREDRQLMRFNNSIAVALLGAAQIAFIAGLPVLGWALSLMVAVAAGIALAGFCIGCFLYFQLKQLRARGM